MPALELHQIDQRHAALRIADPLRRSRLEADLAHQGQQVPVVVVPGGEGRYVLIDGFARVGALKRLGHDTVQAVVLDVGEAEALVLRHRMEQAGRRCALEEGWLVRALCDLGCSHSLVALDLARSGSWVSRRLALVHILPETVQDAVRTGRIGANGAERYLVPLARANARQCAALVEALRTVRPTVRQLARLYAAWKAADDEVREHIVATPLLYLEAEEAVRPDDEDLAVLRDVEGVSAACARARKSLRGGSLHRLPSSRRPQLAAAWAEARLAYGALSELLSEGGVDARP
jgi:ParB family transcriptional regulator, chromosome partitioning protein